VAYARDLTVAAQIQQAQTVLAESHPASANHRTRTARSGERTGGSIVVNRVAGTGSAGHLDPDFAFSEYAHVLILGVLVGLRSHQRDVADGNATEQSERAAENGATVVRPATYRQTEADAGRSLAGPRD
jgi:hypothetical protein